MNTKREVLVDAGTLRVWWVPQVPGEAFHANVSSVDEARLLLPTLARYDAFQYENHIKPDYCNAGGLEIFEDGQWIAWVDENGDEL
jgi:hypothetical protein